MLTGNPLNAIHGTKDEVDTKLKDLANGNCNKCHGRGHRGFNRSTRSFLACKCVAKNSQKMKEGRL